MEKRPARQVNTLYEESKLVANCEAWWYQRDEANNKYILKGRLVPSDSKSGTPTNSR